LNGITQGVQVTQCTASKWQQRLSLGKKLMVSAIAFTGVSLVEPAALLAQDEVHPILQIHMQPLQKTTIVPVQ
jgi:hypothetical protein